MPSCGVCGKAISAEEMKKDVFGGLMDQIWAGTPFAGNMKFMPNVMEKLAMKCNRCGVWICGACAEKTAMSQSAGMIRHTDCGGMFETQK
jgi:hypothetical protein